MGDTYKVICHRDGSISHFSCREQVWKDHTYTMDYRDLLAESATDQLRIQRHFERHGWLAPRAAADVLWRLPYPR